MEPRKIDQYISKFEELARHANYTVGNEKTARLFLEGLTTQVMQNVLTTDGLNGYEDYKRCAVDTNKNRSILSQILQSRDGRQKGGTPRYSFGPQNNQRNPFFYRGSNLNYARQTLQYNMSNAPPSMNNQPVAMDLSRSDANWHRRGNQGRGRGRYEETPQSKDRLSHIHADLAVLSVDEKEQLAKEMGIAPAEDFRTA
jgi:hypothetical protein